ncbi:hypothetical protein QTN25_009747 [Entamoeba marina]
MSIINWLILFSKNSFLSYFVVMSFIPLDDFVVHNVDLGFVPTEAEVEKRHPTFIETLLFRRAPKYISKGRKGGLNVDEIGQLPSTLNIEKNL